MASLPPPTPIGQRLSLSSNLCTVHYHGPLPGTSGTWLGVEWDNPSLGKHTGTHNGIKYFSCLSSPSVTAGSFIRPSRPRDEARSFLDALRDKYVAGEGSVGTSTSSTPRASASMPSTSTLALAPAPAPKRQQIFFNGKLAEEIGFEKVAAQQALLGELRVVVLDGGRVAGLTVAGEDEGLMRGRDWEGLVDEVRGTCGSIVELDLSRNLMEGWGSVVGICAGLPKLRKLVLDGNRLAGLGSKNELGSMVFANIKETSTEGMLQTWKEITSMLQLFPFLEILSLASNKLSHPFPTLPTPHLTHLNLSSNPIPQFTDIHPFSTLQHLKTLTLQSCAITSLTPLPQPFLSLTHLDISSNLIPTLHELTTLPSSFPILTSLRCSSNPFYTSLPAEEAHMLTAARIPSITMLNYSRISAQEREDAELYYLSRIRLEISSSTNNTSANINTSIHKTHPLLDQLTSKHSLSPEFSAALALAASSSPSNPDPNGPLPNTLAARLIHLTFTITTITTPPNPSSPPHHKDYHLTIPKSSSPYRLKSLLSTHLHISPRNLRLTWETGEIDPIARNLGFPGRVGEGRRIAESEDGKQGGDGDDAGWVRREVELGDSTRGVGYWIEGRRAVVRVEILGDD